MPASHLIIRLTIVLSLLVLGIGGAKETLVREFAGSGLSNTHVAANQMGGGAGSSFQPKGGTYYLQVNATGNWKIKIVPYQVKQ